MKIQAPTTKYTLVGVALTSLLLAGCSVQGSNGGTPDSTDEADSANITADDATDSSDDLVITAPADVPEPDDDTEMSIAFFGFARANSFAVATFDGIQEYAEENNASVEFYDPNFDAQTQVNQIQDAVTAGSYDVFIVQANDGTAVMPAVEQALDQDITVVIEFTPVGTRYDTAEPQIPGTITIIDIPSEGGTVLAEMAAEACETIESETCNVPYLEGFRDLPLDNARTDAFTEELSTHSNIELAASIEGGYTADSGRAAMQDIQQAHSDLHVVVGSSQAIMGASDVGSDEIAYIGNGGSRQAIQAVKDGEWWGTYCIPERTAGATAAALGLAAARGADVPTTNESVNLSPVDGRCTTDSAQDVEGEYDE